MKTGFIGTGNMGSILIEAFLRSKAASQQDTTIHNRTISKAERLKEHYPDIRIAKSNIEVALNSEVIFLCVKPLEFKKVIDEINKVILPDQIVVSITSPVLLEHLEKQLHCKIAKMIPSVTNYVLSGATLLMYGSRMNENDREWLEAKLSCFSTPLKVSEDFTRVASDVSSCGPAFLAFFLQKFIDAAVEEAGIERAEVTDLATAMLSGTAQLLTAGGFTPMTLQEKVSVPGGITAEGLAMLENELKGVFNQLIRTTHAKYEEDVKKVEESLNSPRY